jgi:hypothetical protein
MRNFLKNLGVTAVTIFTIISFIRWDIDVSDWDNSGRLFYTVVVLFISGIITKLQEEHKS